MTRVEYFFYTRYTQGKKKKKKKRKKKKTVLGTAEMNKKRVFST